MLFVLVDLSLAEREKDEPMRNTMLEAKDILVEGEKGRTMNMKHHNEQELRKAENVLVDGEKHAAKDTKHLNEQENILGKVVGKCKGDAETCKGGYWTNTQGGAGSGCVEKWYSCVWDSPYCKAEENVGLRNVCSGDCPCR